jgi:hypothetical protein
VLLIWILSTRHVSAPQRFCCILPYYHNSLFGPLCSSFPFLAIKDIRPVEDCTCSTLAPMMAIFPKWLTKGVIKVLKAGKYIPVVKVIQAGHGVADAGQAVKKCIDVGDTINETTPAIRLMFKSCCDTATFISSLVGLVPVAGIAANIIQTYQGIDAHRQIGARLSNIHNS